MKYHPRPAKVKILLISSILIFSLATLSGQIKVIYETDMETDCDDTGALAMLHAMADNGEVELLAVMHNTSDNFSVGYIDAVNTYYNRPDLPIGAYKRDDTYSRDIATLLNCCTEYTRQIDFDSRFPHDVFTRADVPDATDLYKKILSNQPDNSVTIISVGYLINLRYLIEDPVGMQLVKQKVKELVIFEDNWLPEGTRHVLSMNLGGQQINYTAAMASMYVFKHWPTPMHLSANTISREYYKGEGLKETPENNPVREAYKIYMSRYNTMNQHLMDLGTVYYAIYRESKPDLWEFGTNGTPDVGFTSEPNGIRYFYCVWDPSRDSQHLYWVIKEDKFKEISDQIGKLIVQLPVKNRK